MGICKICQRGRGATLYVEFGRVAYAIKILARRWGHAPREFFLNGAFEVYSVQSLH